MTYKIPVHDFVLVKIVNAEENLPEYFKCFSLIEFFLVFEFTKQLSTFDQLRNNVEILMIFIKPINVHDIWMVLHFGINTNSLRMAN